MQAAHAQKAAANECYRNASVTAPQLLERHINGYDGLAPWGEKEGLASHNYLFRVAL